VGLRYLTYTCCSLASSSRAPLRDGGNDEARH
jgi:hypothetical protein